MMKHYGFLGCFLLSAVFALPARAEVSSPVVFSEINWAGSQTSTADEWLELVNLSDRPVDVSGWVITGAATGGGAIQIGVDTIIEGHSTLVIANYNVDDPKTTLAAAPDLVTTAVSLSNSNLSLMLALPDGVVVDTMSGNIGATNPATSMERNLETLIWSPATISANILDSTQLGTPGQVTFPIVVAETPVAEPPVEEVVLGVVSEEALIEQIVEIVPAEETETPEMNTPGTQVPEEETLTIPVETPEETELIPEPEPVVIETVVEVEVPETPVVNTPVVQTIAPGDLVLNEIVSDPTDDIEWVEIWNISSSNIDLSGCTLVDAGQHSTSLAAAILEPDAYTLVVNPVGNLNNTGDTITLFGPDGLALDTMEYGVTDAPAPEDGEALAQTDKGTWQITTPTPSAPNIFPTSSPEPEMTTDDASEKSSYETLPSDTYETIADTSHSPLDTPGTPQGTVATPDYGTALGSGSVHRIVATAEQVTEKTKTAKKTAKTSAKASERVTIEGTVVALPGTFGKQTMFLNGHEIYFNAADWPQLALGDVVRIQTKPSTKDGHQLWKITGATDLTILRHETAVPLTVNNLSAMTHGMFVNITGQLINKDTVELSNGEQVKLVISKSGGRLPSFSAGIATVTGIVKFVDGSPKLALRSTQDITVTKTESAVSQPERIATRGPSPLLGGGLLTGSLGALGTWYMRARKLASGVLPL